MIKWILHQRISNYKDGLKLSRYSTTVMIKRTDSADQRNYVLANIIPALAGFLTPNFKQISFNIRGSLVVINFDLRVEDHADMKSIDSVISNINVRLATRYELECHVEIGREINVWGEGEIVIRTRDFS